MRGFFVLLAVLMVAGVAEARNAEYEVVKTDQMANMQISVDNGSLETNNREGTVRAAYKISRIRESDQFFIDPGNEGVSHLLSVSVFDCINRKQQTIYETTTYKADPFRSKGGNIPLNQRIFEPIRPGSGFDAIWQHVCKKGNPWMPPPPPGYKP